MSSDRFHKAAKDGLIDVLKVATRKDANSKDSDSMTPVLWAAFEGRLDALRLLCGRGGDPDKCDQFGNTALHLASAKGHLRCVDFLVKFGVNIYALDIDKHSAKDLAAINNCDDILRYLDNATAAFEATDKRKAKALKEMAEKNCEKRVKEYMKRQQKLEQSCAAAAEAKVAAVGGKSSNMLSTLKQKIWLSQGNLNKPPREPTHSASPQSGVKFSELVGPDRGSCKDSLVSRSDSGRAKTRSGTTESGGLSEETGFKIGEVEADGRRTVLSLNGLQRDSEVLYVGSFSSSDENAKRGRLSGLFEADLSGNSDSDRNLNKCADRGSLSRSFSQPDFLAQTDGGGLVGENGEMQRQVGLFDRPTLGSIAFRRSVTAALSQLQPESNSSATSRSSSTLIKSRCGKPRLFSHLTDDSDSDGGEAYSEDDQDVAGGPIQRFLAVWGLEEYLAIFQKQQIDLDTLMLLTEADLKSLALPLGPFRKLTFAIQERKSALANPGILVDSHL